jgi:calpain-15
MGICCTVEDQTSNNETLKDQPKTELEGYFQQDER